MIFRLNFTVCAMIGEVFFKLNIDLKKIRECEITLNTKLINKIQSVKCGCKINNVQFLSYQDRGEGAAF